MKPVFLFGNGLRYNPSLVDLLCQLNVPVLTTWQACDLISEDNPIFCGRPGVLGQRAANIIQQNCNWLMVVGARLDGEQVGHNVTNFAPKATKTVVDVDPAELMKYPKEWACFAMDLNHPVSTEYGIRLLPFVQGEVSWLRECKDLYNRLRFELEGDDSTELVNPYSFTRELSNACTPEDILVPGSSGQQSCAFLQSFKVKKGQKVLVCNTIGAMGMEPMAIGAAIASNRRTIVVTGDGGFVQNLQELEVVKRLDLNIHYFIFDNGGYGSIHTMQETHFQHLVGSDPSSGLTLPDLKQIASVWDIPFHTIANNASLSLLPQILNTPKATLTCVKCSLDFRPVYKVASRIVNNVIVSDPMESMTPPIRGEI